MDPILQIGIVAYLGLMVGSFLNVCIYRIPREQSVVRPRSACPHCGSRIAFYDNIPVLSFLILGGKCRHCKAAISWQYPLVETLNTVVWVVVWITTPDLLGATINMALCSVLIALAFIDAHHRILPHCLTFGGMAVALVTSPWQPCHQLMVQPLINLKLFEVLGLLHTSWMWPPVISAVLGLMFGAGMLLAVYFGYYFVKKIEGMGHGDIILMGFVGTMLGWQLTLLTIFMGATMGAIVGSFLVFHSGDSKYPIPFGTFLSGAAIVSLFVGPKLLNWYWGLLS